MESVNRLNAALAKARQVRDAKQALAETQAQREREAAAATLAKSIESSLESFWKTNQPLAEVERRILEKIDVCKPTAREYDNFQTSTVNTLRSTHSSIITIENSINEVRRDHNARIQKLEKDVSQLSNIMSALGRLESSLAKGFENQQKNIDNHFSTLPTIISKPVDLSAVSNAIAELPSRVKDVLELPAVIASVNSIPAKAAESLDMPSISSSLANRPSFIKISLDLPSTTSAIDGVSLAVKAAIETVKNGDEPLPRRQALMHRRDTSLGDQVANLIDFSRSEEPRRKNDRPSSSGSDRASSSKFRSMGDGGRLAVGNNAPQDDEPILQRQAAVSKPLDFFSRVITVGFGNSAASRRAPNPLLGKCGIPKQAYDCILADDLNNGSAFRADSSKINEKGAKICFMSQFLPSKDWPLSSSEPKDDNDARKQWWDQIWTNKKTECPSCAYRRANGEDVRCFYFQGKSKICMLVPACDDAA
ncbi:hypothetical protein N431DRAFT_179245 [Stipitochalara longipes BDJ]|nr:hypothetical protein N431DRAFT_179245 [Stipitochalara longipes BDJ]